MAGTTTKYALPYPTGTDLIKDGDDKIKSLAEAIDAIIATDDQGLLSARPVSTGGSPGKKGRYYFATDVNGGTLYRDNGTGWDVVAPNSPESAFSAYRTLMRRASNISGGLSATTRVLINSTPSGGAGALASDAFVVADADLFWLDPADYTAGARTTKYRVRGICVTNAVAPTGTWTIGLYPVTISYGASGTGSAFTLGTVIAGSTVAFATPGASATGGPTLSGDFTAPAAGWYALAVNNSAVPAANSNTEIYAELQMRQV